MGMFIDRGQLSQHEREVLTRYLGPSGEGDAPWRKFDVNMVDASLLHELGWAPADIDSLRSGRAYYDLRDAARRVSPAGARRLRRLLTVAPLQLPDGAASLSPSDDAWITAPRHPVQAGVPPPESARLAVPTPPPPYERQRRRQRGADQLESMDTTRFPALVDADGQTRYADPRFVVVQARTPADDPALLQSLQALDLQVHKLIMPNPALMVLRLGSERHGLAGLSNCLMALKGAPWVEVVEPAWLGFDDLSELLRPHAALPAGVPSDSLSLGVGAPVPWNLLLMDWPKAGGVPAGSPEVCLALVDTGLDLGHPAFAVPAGSQARRERLDMGGGDGGDVQGHGTAVASVLAAQRGAPWFGLAPGCSLLSLRVPMVASVESYALRRAALLALRARVVAGTQRWVVNLSWRTAGDVALIRTAIEALTSAGALVVCSAGNEGDTSGRPHFPSDYPGVLSVGALDPLRRPAPYSNLGPRLDFMAPGGVEGVPVVCAAPGGAAVDCVGSSFASPHVAAAAALLWSHYPQDSAVQLKDRLGRMCDSLAPQAGVGHGMPRLNQLLAPVIALKPQPSVPTEAWPLPGDVLLARAEAACGLKPITRRILLTRTRLGTWEEVAGVLGMTAQTLDCLRRHWSALP